MVIDGAWRALGPGLESLSGPGGAPLTRTVKLILLPLIVRPALHPDLAADFLAPEPATRLDALLRESGARLIATAQWFTLLKRTRRALGIVAGHPRICTSSGASNWPPSMVNPAPPQARWPGRSSRTSRARTAVVRSMR